MLGPTRKPLHQNDVVAAKGKYEATVGAVALDSGSTRDPRPLFYKKSGVAVASEVVLTSWAQ